MQAFTKTEISWIILELDKQTAALKWSADNPMDRKFDKELSETYRLRAEQYADISQRLRLALKEGNRRIEIK